MARLFGAMARGVAGYRKGQAAAEQQRYERDLQERELQSRAAQEFVRNAQWERQHAYTQQRDQMVDQRMRDLDAAEEQRRAEQKRADMLGSGKWESADDTDLGVAAETAMSVLGGGIPQTRSNVQGPAATQRVQANIDGVEYAAPERKGFAYERVGGKLLRMDRQADANAPWMKAITEAQLRVKDREDKQAQEKAMRDLVISSRQPPQPRGSFVQNDKGEYVWLEAGTPGPTGVMGARSQVGEQVKKRIESTDEVLRDLDNAISALETGKISASGAPQVRSDVMGIVDTPTNFVRKVTGFPNRKAEQARRLIAKAQQTFRRNESGLALSAQEAKNVEAFIGNLDTNDEQMQYQALVDLRGAVRANKEAILRVEEGQGKNTTPWTPAPTTGGRRPGQSPSQRAPRGRPSDIR